MPKVPGAFESGIGQAQSNNVPSVFQNGNVSADAFGARRGAALQNAGNLIFDAATKIKDDEDKAQAYNTYSKASEAARDALYNPEGGIYNRKGGSAVGAYKESLKRLDDIYYESSGKLSGGARQRFDEMWRSKRENILEGVSRHEAKERQDYKVQSVAATRKTSVADAIENYNNPAYIADSIAIGEVAILDGMEGAPPEAIRAEMQAHRSEIHTGVITRMVNEGDALGASEYFKKVKDDVVGKEREVLQKLIKTGEGRAASQTSANEIMRKYAGDYDAQIEAAKKIKDEDVRSEVVGLLDENATQTKKITEEQRKQLSAEAWDLVLESGSRHSIPTDQWVALDKETKTAIRQYTSGDPEAIKTDPARWSELYTMYSQNPKEFKKLNLANEIVNLSSSDFKDFTKKQQELIKGNDLDQARTRTDLAIAKTRLNQIGIKTDGKLTEAEAQKNTMFFRALDHQKSLFVEQNDRKPSETEVEEMIDNLTVKLVFDDAVTLNPFDIDTKKFGFEVDGTEDFSTLEVPDDMREKILQGYYDAFGTAASPPTEDDIRRAYIRKVSGI